MFRIPVLCLVTTLSLFQLEANCPRCAVIEGERAKEQAENPQPLQYYDDQVKKEEPKSLTGSTFRSSNKSELNALLAVASNDGSFFEEDSIPGNPKTVQDLKVENGVQPAYSALYTILKTKNFLETLDAPFTILVPTNAALSKLSPGALEKLSKKENAEQLAQLVSNHVIGKKLLRQDFETHNNQEVKAISGRNLTLTSKNGKLFIDDAQVIDIDPAAYQGVIILIDKVLQ